ncbi:class I SAM-dependent methyltransferase [Streptomyces ziwulingensis]
MAEYLERTTRAPLKIGIRAWDGSLVGPDDGAVLALRSPRALAHGFYRPGQLGFTRAFVSGDMEVEGDLAAFVRHMAPACTEGRSRLRDLTHALRAAYRLGIVQGPPPRPTQEVRGKMGLPAAIAHHYDVGNDFYRLLLGPSMVYSGAYWPHPENWDSGTGLDAAQEAKMDVICRKLELKPSMRLLDAGCGWGSLVRYAAEKYGVTAVGVTLSQEQATYARREVRERGLEQQVEIRHCDYRSVTDGPYDAVSAIESAMHLGVRALPGYAASLYGLLAPGGLLLDQHISVAGEGIRQQYGPLVHRYITPGLGMAPLHQTMTAFAGAQFDIQEVENLRTHFAATMRAWLQNLEENWDRAVALVGAERARTWRLYLALCVASLDAGLMGVNHILAVRPHRAGDDLLAPRHS